MSRDWRFSGAIGIEDLVGFGGGMGAGGGIGDVVGLRGMEVGGDIGDLVEL